MVDARVSVLAACGIVGEDAVSALAALDKLGGMRAVYEAISDRIGHDATRVALALLKHSPEEA